MRTRIIAAIAASVIFVAASPLTASATEFIAEDVYESVVVVMSGNSVGSGFAIGEHCIITNAHVTEDVNGVVVKTYGGEFYNAQVASIDTKLDIAVLSVNDVAFPAMKPADIDACKIGDDVYTIGAPSNMAYTLTKGILSAKDRKVGGALYLQTDAAVNSGNSGGPLINASGEVMGMNTLKMSDSEGIGLAIPITTVYDYLDGKDVSVDDDGAVVETFAGAPPLSPGINDKQQLDTRCGSSLIVCLLGLSVALNIILATTLAYDKMKNRGRKLTVSERTDFEIDVWE